MSERIIINKLPAPTFRWLKMNGAEVEAIEAEGDAKTYLKKEGVDDEPVRLNVSFEGDECISPIEIDFVDGSSGTVILNYTADENKPFRMQTDIKLNIAKNSRAKIIQVSALPAAMELRNNIHAVLSDNTHFELIQVVLSGKSTYIECVSELKGEGSYVHIENAYSLHGQESLDINYVANHYGKKTESLMNVYGVLSDESKKIFKGTIDFKKGCAGAVGNENEDVLLLDENISNQTIPLILCAEEDVEGNHGASLGKLSEDVMFYMKSRGMSEGHIYKMMARARIEAVASHIDDEATKEIIAEYL